MSKFKLNPLSIALLGAIATPTFAETTTENQNHQLSTIVVSAAGYEQKLKDAPASITVLTEEDFKTKRINSVADALADVEGVDISPSAGKTGGLNIRMRGMDAEYTLVLIDGRRQNSTGDITPNGFGESNNNFIPPISAIERIEVIRGPASTLYGSDAMGGVVNIITKKVANEWTGSVTLDATVLPNSSEFGNQRAIDAYVSGPLIKDLLGVQLRGRYTERDQSHVTEPNADSTKDDVELTQGNNPTKSDLQTLGARFTLTPTDDHDISFEIENTEQWYDNSKNQLGTLGADGGYADAQEYEREKLVLAHTWRNNIGTLDSSLSQNKTETIGRLIPSRAQEGSKAITPREMKSKDLIFDTKFTTQAVSGHKMTIGGQWWDASISDSLRQNKEVSFTQLGLFAEDTWSLTDSLALTLGLRYDDHDTFGDFWTPRAYLVWNANDNWTFKGGYSEGYKAPRLERLTNGIYNATGQGRTPSFGNPDLKPETSKNFELGTYFNKGNFDYNITAFYSEIDDKITSGSSELRCDANVNKAQCESIMKELGTPWLMQSGDNDNNPDRLRGWDIKRDINADKAEMYGIETGLNWSPTADIKLGLNYTWTKTELKDDTLLGKAQFNDTPEHMVNATAKWQVADNAQLWLRGEYRSERARYTKSYQDLSKDQKPLYDALGDFEAYTLFHMGSNFNVNDNWDIGVALYNIFDKDFTEFEIVNGSVYNRHINSQEGRRVQLSTTFKF
ncbi:TonB-dependent receptor [Acinetobacter faecalis]|uniref:TonB-dependent receptor n=1 Tax=Acinetobacter faecalis TaxID=2665161 RepID=A0A6L6GDW8_9GAMM|nr:TonB-dependent receptor [Acinetobacter faecalis]MDY6523399.1 TonB-dependent receptor [Acinetobacter faecalis]MTD10094.1 TonB-dependent receptor [Acinetobacter faecalis]